MFQINFSACKLVGKYRVLVKSSQGQLQLLSGVYEMVFIFFSLLTAFWGVHFFISFVTSSYFLKYLFS